MIVQSRDSLLPITVKAGEATHTRYGSYNHSNMIGKAFGSKVSWRVLPAQMLLVLMLKLLSRSLRTMAADSVTCSVQRQNYGEHQ